MTFSVEPYSSIPRFAKTIVAMISSLILDVPTSLHLKISKVQAQLERDSGGRIASNTCTNPDSAKKLANGENEKPSDLTKSTSQVSGSESTSQGETIWGESLVLGIDFCNHDLKVVGTWEVDGSRSLTEILFSMYLLPAGNIPLQGEKEISISYSDKGNEYEVAQQLRNKLIEV
ncbi:hypothetical protein C2S52_001082 [Perilla frutescens var. hirtella]|nr:hypothetical protein C2S52_001082 [Perilla frutescens var. hirtella]